MSTKNLNIIFEKDRSKLEHLNVSAENMQQKMIREKFASCSRVLIGLGEEWKIRREDPVQQKWICQAYEHLYEKIKDKDYFIVTMATDAVIFETSLGSRTEAVAMAAAEGKKQEPVSAEKLSGNADAMERFNRLFPAPEIRRDRRFERITAPCGNETWRQCSVGCTKDIWEPGEVPDDICPHCGMPLTGNTIEAHPYIEEGYLPQWNRYNQWLAGTLNQELLILELGVGFVRPGVIRFPFEKTAFFNQKALLCRVHERFFQTTRELQERAVGIEKNSVTWILDDFQ